MAAGEFKAHCLSVLDEVSRTRRGVVITKRGRPVAQVVALATLKKSKSLKGSIVHEEDLLSPVDVKWDAQR